MKADGTVDSTTPLIQTLKTEIWTELKNENKDAIIEAIGNLPGAWTLGPDDYTEIIKALWLT
jgi:hypothetical protein